VLNFIKKSSEYRKIYDQGEKRFSPFFILFITANNKPELEIGITVTKKLGNAVVRNKIKRRLRALALNLDRINPHLNCRAVIISKKSCLDGDFAKMLSSLENLLKK
jgi:ribonuclease P protein component